MAALLRRLSRIVWVFDLDDTLMRTALLYERMIIRAYHFITRHHLRDHAPTLAQFKQKQKEIDSDLRRRINPVTKEPYYYAMERFPLSLVETYEYFCAQERLKPLFEVSKGVDDIGYGVYLTVREYMKYVKPEARTLLPFLRGRGDVLVLLTKGDPRVQMKKIKALKRLGLLKYFPDHFIVRDKNREIFRKIKRRFRGFGAYISVGNEYPSDIEPAIGAGYFGIYIPISSADPWHQGKMDKIEEARDKDHSTRYDSLGEIRRKDNYNRSRLL
ncbi:MAG: HAD family hydrolase [Patescibacteria group bacterium]|nr:HAD family hydrolase [Patescibacteria group bacterium]